MGGRGKGEGGGGREAEDFDCASSASIKNFLIRQKALYKML